MRNLNDLTADVLRRFWNLGVDVLDCIDEETGRRCYRAMADEAEYFVKVQEDKGEFVNDLERGFRVQDYLRKKGFPTNRTCPSRYDNLVERFDGYGILVEPWIERRNFERDLTSWSAFGDLVGQLHSFLVPDEMGISISKMDPNRTRDGVLRQIDACWSMVPKEYVVRLRSLREAAEKIESLKSVPRTLIHSDLAWDNMLQTRHGEFLLVDFEGGGIGPAVMDLVEVTTYLCKGPSASGSLQEDAAVAFYQGYGRHRSLDASEAAAFADAHIYHQLYYLANSLGRGDFGFIDRMLARLDNWNGGVLEELVEIATGRSNRS